MSIRTKEELRSAKEDVLSALCVVLISKLEFKLADLPRRIPQLLQEVDSVLGGRAEREDVLLALNGVFQQAVALQFGRVQGRPKN